MTAPRTLSEKVWDVHVVHSGDDGTDLLFIDLHLVHEVTSPQAFDGLRMAGRPVRRPDLTVATEDHNVPTTNISGPVTDLVSRRQLDALRANCADFGVPLYPMGHERQGIVHVIGPELGLTLPGATVVCGDSHTSTHGAFGALAFGIGTSEVEHVLATQTLPQARPRTMSVTVDGELPVGSGAKDVILSIIGRIGTGGGIGSVIEYRGSAIEALSMEGRMTVCNMSIEAGARAGMVAPDDTTFAYLRGRPHAPAGAEWDKALSPTGGRCAPTTGRVSTPRCISAAPTSRRTSPGAPIPPTWPAWTGSCPTPTPPPTPAGVRPPPGRWSTWVWRPAHPSGTFPWTRCLSARAPTAASRICARPRRWRGAGGWRRACAR